MIDRYAYPQMRALWEPENRFAKWLEVELLVAEALAEIGQIPKQAAQALRRNARFDVQRILEVEGEAPGYVPKPGEEPVRHDLIAFLKAVSENLGDEAKYLHLGVTSYDIEDTALGALLRDSADLLDQDLAALAEAIRERAREHKWTLMMGRTHGVHAEPITLGFKLAVWLDAVNNARERLRQAKEDIAVGKISGAVGTYANIDPRVEQHVCEKLALKPAPISTQIVQRDRHARYVCTLAVIAASIEQFATEVRNLQRTEILELEEPFAAGQRGSSAMPHKRNPMTCERLTALARIMRSYVLPALENVATWHERDLTNSAVERLILPDANVLLDYMLRKFTDVVRGLVVYPERMRENMARLQGVVASQQVMLALVGKGMDKDEAYRLAQTHALAALEQGRPYREALAGDAEVTRRLSSAELDACFDAQYHLRRLEEVFRRLGI
jgi:adenylosuccinate lyase